MDDNKNQDQTQKPEAGATGAIPQSTNVAAPVGKAAEIAAKLSGEGQKKTETANSAPKAEEAPVFDLTKLNPDQLQQLKAMLNSTPDRVMMKKGNPIVSIRKYTGQFIIDFKNAINTLVEDKLTRMNSEQLIIPIKFLGAEAFVNIDYRDFMNADQIQCEVLSKRQVPGRIVEGEVVSKETGRLVERAITTVQDFFTIKLPEGSPQETIEIEGRVANQ